MNIEMKYINTFDVSEMDNYRKRLKNVQKKGVPSSNSYKDGFYIIIKNIIIKKIKNMSPIKMYFPILLEFVSINFQLILIQFTV